MLEQAPKSPWFRVQTCSSCVVLCYGYLQTEWKERILAGYRIFILLFVAKQHFPAVNSQFQRMGVSAMSGEPLSENKQQFNMSKNTAHLYISCWRRELPISTAVNSWEGEWFYGLSAVSPLDIKRQRNSFYFQKIKCQTQKMQQQD